MSWSLQVSNGDLSFGTKGLNVVSGAAKLTQDLRYALLTPVGSDPMHPAYGSTLDGGIASDGTYTPGVIGLSNDATTGTLIQAEVQRVAKNYQRSQIARNQSDVAIYGKSTLTADEALLSLGGVDVQAAQDHALVTVNLQTGNNSLPLSVPFTTS